MELLTLLLNPKVIAVIGPVGAILLGVCVTFYKLMSKFIKKYEDEVKRNDTLQEKRIAENKDMQKEYLELAHDIEKTMDVLIKTVSRKNGNGGSNKNV